MPKQIGRPKEHKKTEILTISVESGLPEALQKIAGREGKSRSRLVEELLSEYVTIHLAGNPAYTLENFAKDEFKAWPTAWEFWDAGFDKDLPDKEFLEMARLIRNKTKLMNGRLKKLDWHWNWS